MMVWAYDISFEDIMLDGGQTTAVTFQAIVISYLEFPRLVCVNTQ